MLTQANCDSKSRLLKTKSRKITLSRRKKSTFLRKNLPLSTSLTRNSSRSDMNHSKTDCVLRTRISNKSSAPNRKNLTTRSWKSINSFKAIRRNPSVSKKKAKTCVTVTLCSKKKGRNNSLRPTITYKRIIKHKRTFVINWRTRFFSWSMKSMNWSSNLSKRITNSMKISQNPRLLNPLSRMIFATSKSKMKNGKAISTIHNKKRKKIMKTIDRNPVFKRETSSKK